VNEPVLGEQYADLPQQARALTAGMWAFLATEILLFGGLFAVYAGYRAMYRADFDAAIDRNTLAYGTVNMYVLLLSSFTVALSIWAVRRARLRVATLMLAATIVLGTGFLVIKGFEYAKHIHEGALPGADYRWHELPTYGANRFFTLYWVMTGLHAVHVTVGVLLLGWFAVRTWRGRYTPAYHVGLEMGALYWHLVDVIWIFLWPLMYLA
jgi:cytochrome c oxidase subunit 3